MKQVSILIIVLCNWISFSQESRGSVSAQTTTADSGTKRALIVGISDYIEEKLKLNYAENDAALFRDYLSKVEKLPEENITYLADQDAVSPIILKELSAIYKASNEGDWLYFYFAGHGDVVEDFGDKEGFLLAADANANQEYYANGAISLDLLNNKIIGNLVKKGVKVVLVLDACHSGFIFEEGTQRNLGSIQAMFENTTKILSCGPNELSYESGDLQHGYFTYYLIKGLMGTADSNTDNALIFRELDDYLYDNVNATVSKKYNKQQTPVLRTQNDRATFRDINPNETSIAFEAISKSLKTDKGYASRGSLNTSNPEMEHPIVKKFAEAIDKSRLHGSENSAYELYLSAKKEKAVSESILNRMQNALIRDLSTSAQKLINQYIDNTSNLPQGREFQKQARNLEVCLTLLDEEEFLRNKIYTSKLLLEAYADIRNRNYSRYRIAKSKLKEALSIEPRAAYIHNALGMVYNYEEVYDSAHFHFNKAKELIHSWNAPISNLGENLLDQYKYDEAKTLLNTAIGNEGDSFSAHLQLGAVSESEGNYPQAESHYKKALELSPNNALAMQKMAHLQTIRGNSKAAQDWYNKAFKDTNILKSSNLLHYIQSQNLDNQTAQKLLLEAIDSEPHYSQVYAQYADYLRMHETKLTRLKLADSMYATAIEKDPFNTWAYAGRAWLYLDLKRPTKAVQLLEQGIKNNPNKPEAYFYYANYLKDGETDTQKAETYYLKAIEKDTYYIAAYKNLVDLYIGQNQQDKATALLQNALANNPNAPDFWNLMGNVHFSQNAYNKAIEAYNKAIALDTGYANSYSKLGYSELQENQLEAAKSNFKKANSVNPELNKTSDIAEVMLNMAANKERFGTPDEAEALYKLAFDFDASIKTGLAYSQFLYLHNNSVQAFEVAKTLLPNATGKDYSAVLSMLIKSAIDNNDATNADAYMSKLTVDATNPDDMLLVGIYYAFKKDTQKRNTFFGKTNPEFLRSQKLREQYSQNTIDKYIFN